MRQGFSATRRRGLVLFDEDFDLPPPAAEPEVIEPVYSAAELRAACEAAAGEAHEAALAEAATSTRAAASQALTAIAAGLAAARDDAATMAEQSAEAIAGLLLCCFAAAFPALSETHGEAEVAAMLRAILPTLRHEPKINVHVNAKLIDTLEDDLRSLDPEVAARARLIPSDTLAMGSARVSWEHGAAVRDPASLWRQIENILAPTGLLAPNGPLAPVAPAAGHAVVKEHAIVD